MNFKKTDIKKSYLSDPDVQLMLQFQQGEILAFEALMKKHFSALMNFSYKFTGNRAISEEITQEVFIRVYQSKDSYVPQASLRTWLYTIARNLSLNELRKNKQKMISIDQPIDVGEGNVEMQVEDRILVHPDEEVLAQERQLAVRQAIVKLPKNQRTALILRRYDDFSYQEIAKIMNLSQKAVKSLLSRAKENVKSALLGFMHDEE